MVRSAPIVLCFGIFLSLTAFALASTDISECERLGALVRIGRKNAKALPWAATAVSNLTIESNLSSLPPHFYLGYELDVMESITHRALATFDNFVGRSHIQEELTDAELDVFQERFVARLRVEFECQRSHVSWRDAAARAFESEKPRLTTALATHLQRLEVAQHDRPSNSTFRALFHGYDALGTSSPSNAERKMTTYEWCDCKTGLDSIVFWSQADPSNRVTVMVNSVRWLIVPSEITEIGWICNGMSQDQDSKMDTGFKMWSLQFFTELKAGFVKTCSSNSGRIRVNTWSSTNYVSSVPFTSNTEGYACMKIPYMLRTTNGSLLAFAEARTPNCSDFAKTDMVYKRSIDGGRTWSALNLVVKPETEEGLCGAPIVVGNMAPVQLSSNSKRHPDRILVPHTRNNFRFWITYSDDDGLTWSQSKEIPNVTQTAEAPDCQRGMKYFGFDVDSINLKNIAEVVKFAEELGWGSENPFESKKWRAKMTGPWQFMGLGPPGGLQLTSGRVIAPGYHSWIRGLSGGNGSPGQLPISQLYNNLAFGHLLVSDDDGDSWSLKSGDGFGNGLGQGANEDQMVQLGNGSILVNSRSLATGTPQYRVQARSDDDGETFTPTQFVYDLPEPFNGCQGSFVRGTDDILYVSHPDPAAGDGLVPDLTKALKAFVNLTGRDHMTVFKSSDRGATYADKLLVDAGSTGYSALQYYGDKLGLLYEQADPAPFDVMNLVTGTLNVEVPTRFIFREISTDEFSSGSAPTHELFV